jgi:hypothetical protein
MLVEERDLNQIGRGSKFDEAYLVNEVSIQLSREHARLTCTSCSALRDSTTEIVVCTERKAVSASTWLVL